MRNSMNISVVDDNGQAFIPKAIQDYLHLCSGHRISFIIEPNGQVVIRPIKRDISELEGFLPSPKKPVTLEEIDAVIRRRGSELC